MKRMAVIVACVHANNSGGILHQPSTLFDLVRPGLMMYGIIPRGRRRVDPKLHALLATGALVQVPDWACEGNPPRDASQLRRQLRLHTEDARRHADRRLWRRILPSGEQPGEHIDSAAACRILGNVTMDQMLADITQVQDAVVGDEVVLIGQQGRREYRPAILPTRAARSRGKFSRTSPTACRGSTGAPPRRELTTL